MVTYLVVLLQFQISMPTDLKVQGNETIYDDTSDHLITVNPLKSLADAETTNSNLNMAKNILPPSAKIPPK